MNTTKKILCLVLACLMVVGMFAGCSKKDPVKDPTTPPQTQTQPTDPSQPVGETVSVGELKNKYGESDAGKLLPMYNLDPNEPLKITLKYTPTNDQDVFSIHTDEKCLDASKIAVMVSPSDYNPTGPKTYEVKPLMAPLSNSKSEGLWGGVSNYFIKFNYDITAETETKLETPVIVAFSIKSPAAIPNTSYTMENGCFTLTWTPVEGATAYRIYQRQVIKLLETTNIAPSGKEEGYSGAFPLLVKEVSADTLSYNDWLGDGKGGTSKIEFDHADMPFINSYQNQGVNGEYYVTAVVDGKESLFSMGVNTTNLDLPKEFDGGSLLYATYDGPEDLPTTVAIKYVDGSVKTHKVFYTSLGGKDVKYVVENTAITGIVTVRENGEYIQPEPEKPDSNGGFIAPDNKTEQNAPADVPTINDGKGNTEGAEKPSDAPSTPNEPTDPSQPNEPSEPTQEPEKTVTEQQAENTKEVLEEANKATVEVPKEIKVTASSAAEEYLALNLVAGNKEISLAAFPELQVWANLQDILSEVIYQNPMILGARSYSYNYGTMILTMEYDYSVEEIKTRQDEILAEGAKIIGEIITSGMTDAEKRRAIYDYLEANTTYDDAACDDAKENNFQGMNNDYRDSFSTYGILVKKTGVCQSYAYAFDYLCELAGVNCIIVTGDMMGYLPHAWNKVEVDGEWLVIDVTNNEKSIGIEDFMYENPDAVAYALGYIEDDLWYTADDNVYHSTNVALSKYKDCLITNTTELDTYVREHAKAGATVEFLVVYEGFESDDVVAALAKTDVKELGSSIVICGYVWFEVVS